MKRANLVLCGQSNLISVDRILGQLALNALAGFQFMGLYRGLSAGGPLKQQRAEQEATGREKNARDLRKRMTCFQSNLFHGLSKLIWIPANSANCIYWFKKLNEKETAKLIKELRD